MDREPCVGGGPCETRVFLDSALSGTKPALADGPSVFFGFTRGRDGRDEAEKCRSNRAMGSEQAEALWTLSRP